MYQLNKLEMENPLRITDLPEVVQSHLKGVAEETRLWTYERSQIAQAVDFIDDRVAETSGKSMHSLWSQLVLLVYNTLNLEDQETQRESWLALGEVRQAIRQAMVLDPMVGAGAEGSIFRGQFSGVLDHILEGLSPDPKTLS